jgi:hypothetical protein
MTIKVFSGRSAAFTIIEMAIAMIVSSIVISFCYYMYLFINGIAEKYRTRNRSIDEYYLFSSTLQRDVDRAELIKDTIDSSRFELTGDENRVSYFFGQNFVVREGAGEQDTFRIGVAIERVGFVHDSLNLVEKIVVQVDLDTGRVHFLINKQYSAEQIMKAEEYKKDEQIN